MFSCRTIPTLIVLFFVISPHLGFLLPIAPFPTFSSPSMLKILSKKTGRIFPRHPLQICSTRLYYRNETSSPMSSSTTSTTSSSKLLQQQQQHTPHSNNTSSNKFIVKSPFQPSGDQPEAIAELTDQLNRGEKFAVLKGITGE